MEKAFFKAAPEFGTTGSAIRADVISPGMVLIQPGIPPGQGSDDPMIGAWLSFLEASVRGNPALPVPFKMTN